MNRTLLTEMTCMSLFIGMTCLAILCDRIGRRKRHEDGHPEVSGVIISALFALLGLLIAFTFSGAYSRFDARRQLTVEEANAIGTAYLRVDLLPLAAQGPVREKFREYASLRAALYPRVVDSDAVSADLAEAAELQQDIWARVIAATTGMEQQTTRMLLLPAINEMIDIVTTRSVAIQTHPPALVWAMLFCIALTCAGLTGYRAGLTKGRGSLYHVLLAAIIASILYVTLDIEYPRHGLVRLDSVNQVLVNVAKSMQ